MRRWGYALPLAVAGCAAGVRAPETPPAPPSGATQVDERPRPPDDLDARLVEHYPLRGLLLGEDGSARMRFTVEASGRVTVGELLSASRPEYAVACRRMLEETVWTPARTAGAPTSFSSSFTCGFDHYADREEGPRPAAVAVGPVAPDYGNHWWDRYSDSFMHDDAAAELRIEVGVDGRVAVTSVVEGSDGEVARACSALLEQGPPWVPAKDQSGHPVTFRGTFRCLADVEGRGSAVELSARQVSTMGPIDPEVVTRIVADNYPQLTRCLGFSPGHASAVGQHWLAFEIRPDGHVGRVEWVEPPRALPERDACLARALQSWRFPPAPARTIADIKLDATFQGTSEADE